MTASSHASFLPIQCGGDSQRGWITRGDVKPLKWNQSARDQRKLQFHYSQSSHHTDLSTPCESSPSTLVFDNVPPLSTNRTAFWRYLVTLSLQLNFRLLLSFPTVSLYSTLIGLLTNHREKRELLINVLQMRSFLDLSTEMETCAWNEVLRVQLRHSRHELRGQRITEGAVSSKRLTPTGGDA